MCSMVRFVMRCTSSNTAADNVWRVRSAHCWQIICARIRSPVMRSSLCRSTRTGLAERGFNQAELLAREVARATGLPLIVGPLVRIRATRQQALLDITGRIENVTGAFVWRGPPPPARVALVDDVLTTGATVNACAQAVRAGGARDVYALALARSRRST